MDRRALLSYAADTFGTQPEYPWEDEPGFAVLRHRENRKWYAVIMNVQAKRLGLEGGEIDIVNLKCDPAVSAMACDGRSVLPAYHMNKTHWISVVLGAAPDDELLTLLNMSYELTAYKPKARKE